MVTKLKKTSSTNSTSNTNDAGTAEGAAPKSGPQLSDMVKESAQQIWQAGLGAFAKAQAEGTKAFEALVKEGSLLQRKTQAAAEEKVNEATSRMASMATDISSKATGQWDKLESIFEERVAKALRKLGVPSAKDIDALIARIDALNQSVQKMAAQAPARKTTAKPAAKVAPTAAAKSGPAAAPAATKRKAAAKKTSPAR